MRVYGIVRLTKDLELQRVGESQLLKTSVAFNDRKGNGHFFNVAAWNKNAENIAKFFRKGDKIFIVGRLENNNYTNKEGQKVFQDVITINEWEFVEQKDGSKQDYKPSEAQKEAQQVYESHQEKKGYEEDDSSLPF